VTSAIIAPSLAWRGFRRDRLAVPHDFGAFRNQRDWDGRQVTLPVHSLQVWLQEWQLA